MRETSRSRRAPRAVARSAAPFILQSEETMRRRAQCAGAEERAGAQARRGASSRGAALPRPARQEMEARLGHDFGSVRVHTDAQAAAAAAQIGATAYTVGPDVYFG